MWIITTQIVDIGLFSPVPAQEHSRTPGRHCRPSSVDYHVYLKPFESETLKGDGRSGQSKAMTKTLPADSRRYLVPSSNLFLFLQEDAASHFQQLCRPSPWIYGLPGLSKELDVTSQ